MIKPINNQSKIVVEVFKTNVCDEIVAATLTEKLKLHFPCSKFNFDLSDCDNILRAEGENISVEKITALINACGYKLEILL